MNSWPLPWCTSFTVVGSFAAGTAARPVVVSAADEVLHRHRLAGAQQRPVEHRRGAQVGLGAAAGRHVEAPRLDALLPAAEDEGDVGRAALLVGLAGGDEVAAIGGAVVEVRIERPGHDRQALGVAAPGPERLAGAVVDDDIGAFDRLAAVERCHPDDAVLAPELEMHAEVGDQDAGAHVHRRALVEQRLAEAQRLDLDHVVARLGERQADHLERPRVAAGELRQLEPPRAGIAAEQRDLARADPALDLALDRPALGVDVVLGGEPLALRQAELLGGELGLVVLLQLRVPGQDLGVALQPLDPHLAGAGRGRRAAPRLAAAQLGLHVAQGHRQHRLGMALDHAERRRRELGDRRRRAGGDLERKAARRWRAAGRRCPSARAAGRRCRPRSRPAAWERRSRSPPWPCRPCRTPAPKARRSPAPAGPAPPARAAPAPRSAGSSAGSAGRARPPSRARS